MKTSIVPMFNEAPLELLRRCGGWYECPKDANGKRLGPLVGYAGRDNRNRQFVGDIYANFSAIEEYPQALAYTAGMFDDLVQDIKFDTFCAMPMGGILLGGALSQALNQRCIFAEKKVVAVATADSREKSQLFFGRHVIRPGERVVLVEDIVNNVTTTEEAIGLVHVQGGVTKAIVCFLNRSLKVESVFTTRGGHKFPLFSLVRQPIEQYEQDHPAVAADIAAGNVVWKPKDEWARLEQAMARQQTPYQHEPGDDGP